MPEQQTKPWRRYYNDQALVLDRIDTPPEASIEELIAETLKSAGDAPYLTTCLPNGAAATLTFREVAAISAAVARYLREGLDLRPGDVVAIQAPNCAAYGVAMIGVLRAGLTLSNINPLYTPTETRRQLEDCSAKALIFIDLFGGQIDEATSGMDHLHRIKITLVDFFPPLKKFILGAALKYLRKLVPAIDAKHTVLTSSIKPYQPDSGQPLHYEKERTPKTPSFLQYSGGTTGRSKGVELTFAGLMHNIEQVGAMAPELLERKQRTTVLVLPLYHMFGFFLAMTGLRHAGHLVLIPTPRPLSNLKTAFEQYQPDVFPGVNTLFAQLLKEEWYQKNPPQIELTVTGATVLNSAVAKYWVKATGSKILESYGMTEATTVLTSNPPGPGMRPDSVGLPVPGTDIRILSDNGEWAKTGEPGEIVAKGPQVMQGYFNAPDLNANAFHEGWLKTGDVGFLDADGYLHLVDRKKDMILVSGFNVYPNEIEDVLTQHHGVLEAGVVGLPNVESSEDVVAFIVKKDPGLTEEQLRTHCETVLTNYKRPKVIRFIDELPKSPVGKVLRRELREQYKTGDGA
ncbi:MAG: AMP-binding protein [Pseudomonadota bacterium]